MVVTSIRLNPDSAALESAYKGAVLQLQSSAERAAQLQRAQQAWLAFRDTNCAFARLVAPAGYAEEFFFDCMLRSAIDRRIELRSLIGD